MDDKKDLTEEEQFEAFVDAADTSGVDGLIDPEDIPGLKKRKKRSKYFTEEELDGMPSYTKEELAALPKPWTKRGEMTRADKTVIQGVVDKNRTAARIFVTGEVAERYIGEAATRFLINVNDVYYENNAGCEPLFIGTRKGTVRMTRFDPVVVWRYLHPDILVELATAEITRLGTDMDPRKMDSFCFYRNMIAAIKTTHGEDIAVVKKDDSVDDFYHGVYLSCLFLFGKPGYMGVPVAEHFAQEDAVAFLRGMDIVQLNETEREKLAGLRKAYGNIQALTNPEMGFVVDLYEGALR